jgi:hypothetical protein
MLSDMVAEEGLLVTGIYQPSGKEDKDRPRIRWTETQQY